MQTIIATVRGGDEQDGQKCTLGAIPRGDGFVAADITTPDLPVVISPLRSEIAGDGGVEGDIGNMYRDWSTFKWDEGWLNS